jgi:hypothetical protein
LFCGRAARSNQFLIGFQATTNFHNLLFLNLLTGELLIKMSEQKNSNTRTRVFDDLRQSLFLTRESISFEVDRAVSDRFDEIIDELCDCLSDEMREEFTRAKLCELCLTALVDDYEKNKLDSLFVQVTEGLRQPSENKSDVD